MRDRRKAIIPYIDILVIILDKAAKRNQDYPDFYLKFSVFLVFSLIFKKV